MFLVYKISSSFSKKVPLCKWFRVVIIFFFLFLFWSMATRAAAWHRPRTYTRTVCAIVTFLRIPDIHFQSFFLSTDYMYNVPISMMIVIPIRARHHRQRVLFWRGCEKVKKVVPRNQKGREYIYIYIRERWFPIINFILSLSFFLRPSFLCGLSGCRVAHFPGQIWKVLTKNDNRLPHITRLIQ